jgi:hypothetical protein
VPRGGRTALVPAVRGVRAQRGEVGVAVARLVALEGEELAGEVAVLLQDRRSDGSSGAVGRADPRDDRLVDPQAGAADPDDRDSPLTDVAESPGAEVLAPAIRRSDAPLIGAHRGPAAGLESYYVCSSLPFAKQAVRPERLAPTLSRS